MGSPRSLEFVENREPQGCFGADVQALTAVDQDRIHAALAEEGLYHPLDGVTVASDLAYDAAMIKAKIPVRFEEVLPYFDPFNGNEEPLDASEVAVQNRLDIVKEALSWDDHEGLLIAYPCRREEDQLKFLHFIAAIEPQEEEAELTIMDPSELPGVGGVFHKGESETKAILTPEPALGIPVCAYLVKLNTLPLPQAPRNLQTEALPDREAAREEVQTDRYAAPIMM